jgi:hypothetical protein
MRTIHFRGLQGIEKLRFSRLNKAAELVTAARRGDAHLLCLPEEHWRRIPAHGPDPYERDLAYCRNRMREQKIRTELEFKSQPSNR